MNKPTLADIINAASKAGRDTEMSDEYLKIEFSGTYIEYEMEFPKGLDTIDRYNGETHRWSCFPGELITATVEASEQSDRESQIKGIFNYSKEMLPIIVCIDWLELSVILYRPIIMSPKQFTHLIKESNVFNVEDNRIVMSNLNWIIQCILDPK